MLVALQYGTSFDEQKKSHATYVIVYVPINFPLEFCVPPAHKKSHATYVTVYAPMNPIMILCTTGTQKSDVTYVIVYAPMNPL